MSSKGEKQKASRIRITILVVLILAAIGATYYAQFIARTNVWYKHFSYLPIVVAGFWWGMRGLVVAALLGGWLIASHVLAGLGVPIMQDLLRAGMFIIVSAVVGTLRERGLKTERWLQKSEEQLRGVLNASDEIIFVKDLNGCYTLANAVFSEQFKRPLEEILGKTDAELFSKEEAKLLREIDRRVLETGEPGTCEDVLTMGGEEFIFKTTKVPLRNKVGKIIGLCGFANDITERKQAEELLRESEARYRLLFEKIADAVFITGFEGEILEANPAASEQTGYSHDELIGMNIMEDLAAEEPAITYDKAKEQLARGETVYFEEKKRRKDGAIYYTGCAVTQIEYKGRPATLSVNRDITERKRAEEALRRERDLAAALEEATAALTATLDFEEVLDRILEEVGRVVPNDAANIMLIEGDEARIVRWRGYERFGVEKFLAKVVFHILEVRNLKQMRENIEPIVIPDTTTYPGWLDVPVQRWLRSYAAAPIIVRGEVIGFLNVDSATPGFFTKDHAEILRAFANHAAATIENARLYEKVQQELTERVQAEEELKGSFVQLAETVSRALESHDPYTAGHQRRVAELARATGEKMGLDKEQLMGLYIGGLLHDIGKISIPGEILTYPGKLTEAEWRLIRAHTRRGYEILKDTKFPWPVAEIALQHHERLDGSGYPQGLKGEEIFLEARILAVADVVEAMASHRPYRPAHGIKAALIEIVRNKGKLYDPEVVDACLSVFEKGFTFD